MTLYQQIFERQTFDTPEKIGVLSKFIYKLAPIKEPVPVPVPALVHEVVPAPAPEPTQVPVPAPVKVEQVLAPAPNKTQFFTDKVDSLFWCLYISKYGHSEYESIGHGYSNIEIAEKQKIIEYVRKNSGITKTKVMAQEIMSDLMTNKRTTLSVLPAFAAFYNKRIVITKQNKFYIDMRTNNEFDTLYLVKNERGNYGIDYTIPNLTKQIQLNSYDKPLNAISTYKIGDLNELALRVGIDTIKKRNKSELYQEITLKCLW
jgi:hypothetical protein